jgi:hypothetical protein
MARSSNRSGNGNGSEDDEGHCRACVDTDLFAQHLHWLRDMPLSKLEAHLSWALPASKKGIEFTEGARQSILNWVARISEDYGKRADTQGTALYVWEAWALAQVKVDTKAELPEALRERTSRLVMEREEGWMLEPPSPTAASEQDAIPF